MSTCHLHRRLGAFNFRYNAREIEAGERASLDLKATIDKRLTYRHSRGRAQNCVSLDNLDGTGVI